MKFEIFRESDIFNEKRPCNKAVSEGKIWVIEIKTIRNLLELASELKDDVDMKIRYRKYGRKYPSIIIDDEWKEG